MSTNLSRRQFLAWTAAGAAALATRRANAEAPPTIGTGATPSLRYPETTATLPVPDPARIKIIQFTDIHYFCHPEDPALDKRTVNDLPKLRDHAQPDLILVTGDLWHNNPNGKGQEYAEFAISTLESLGVPWLFTWGNHDMLPDYAKGHDTFHEAKNSLYRGGPSAGNYTVQLQDKAGAPLWDLICLNSSSQGLHQPQQQWLANLSAARANQKHPPAFAIYHIPIKHQIDAWVAKQAEGIRLGKGGGSDDATAGVLPLLKDLNTRAGFCGHIHTNRYTAHTDGIDLTFGHSTGWAGWGADVMPKGCTLITLNTQSGSHTTESLLADGSRWQPTPGQQIEQLLDTPWDAPAKHKAA